MESIFSAKKELSTTISFGFSSTLFCISLESESSSSFTVSCKEVLSSGAITFFSIEVSSPVGITSFSLSPLLKMGVSSLPGSAFSSIVGFSIEISSTGLVACSSITIFSLTISLETFASFSSELLQETRKVNRKIEEIILFFKNFISSP